jgi:hypothetical protein
MLVRESGAKEEDGDEVEPQGADKARACRNRNGEQCRCSVCSLLAVCMKLEALLTGRRRTTTSHCADLQRGG